MFLIDKEKNVAVSLNKVTFQELKIQERKHLQEWICKNPDLLGEKLLVIQKEFAGFDDTRERLDLLALDQNGNLVVIENKLDDSGKDVVWQALKYASYCSSLTKSDIRDVFQSYLNLNGRDDSAERTICDFLEIEDFSEVELNNDDQRIIMVAANFRKEITSTVMWLLEHNVKIKCIKVTPYKLDDQILLTAEQIIPVVDAEDYLIKIASKKQEEQLEREKLQNRHTVRLEFWSKLLQEMNTKSSLFSNISPSKDNWIGCGSGLSGVSYLFVITGSYARVELSIYSKSQEDNKEIFDSIFFHKDRMEASFGHELDWQRRDDGKGSRIAYWLRDVSVFNPNDWPQMIEFLTTNMIDFEKAISEVLHEVRRK